MCNIAPVVLFVYNRPYHTKKTIDCLLRNKYALESDLLIYSDASKNEKEFALVDSVRKYIKTIKGFKKIEIIERESNYGLANNIISGVSDVIKIYKKVIVLEDDLITSPFFLLYMNEVLNKYENNDKIFSVTGFSFKEQLLEFKKEYKYSVFFNIRPMSWSWGTWYNRWENIKWDLKEEYNELKINKKKRMLLNRGGTDLFYMLESQMNKVVDSWYVRWSYNAIMSRKYTVYPVTSYVLNHGHDGTGVHKSIDKKGVFVNKEICMDSECKLMEEIEIDYDVVKNFNKVFDVRLIDKVKIGLRNVLYGKK